MDTQEPQTTARLRLYSRCIFFCLLIFMMPIAFAQSADQFCQEADIDQALDEAVDQALDEEPLVKIQEVLTENGYGELVIDGTKGPATLAALRRLCVESGAKTTQELAGRLTGMVRQKYSVQIPPAASESGTAPPPAKKKCTYSSPTVSGPTVFYRWQAEKEASEGDEDDSKECEDVPLSEDAQGALDALEGVAYPNDFLFQCALAARSTAFKCELPLQNQVAQLAFNGPIKDPKQIQLSADCGCSRDFSSLVYGFYPFWLAGDDVQQVNFSLFDRIGFYALTLNKDNGRIEDPLQWNDTGGAAALIKTAHKHRVEVDLTIYASDWQQWTGDVIKIAANEVKGVATQPLHSRYTKGLQAIFPFLDSTTSVTADGVTVIFDNYSVSSPNEKIVSFMTRLSEALDRAGADIRLNIMLGLDMNAIKELPEEQPLFEDLACIVLDDGIKGRQEACDLKGEKDSQVKIDYIFTHLQEPTTNSKKVLRRKIESDFHGLQRKTVLRKVIPIISPYGHERDPRGPFEQFEDDLIYFQDNFKGVGLWPLPLVGDADMETIEKKIIERFTETEGPIHLGRVIDTYAPWLCEFACPNRFWLRASFDLLAGLLLVYALLAIWMCRLRSLYKQYFLYFLAVGLIAVLIALVSLVCDPFWQGKADGVVITVFLIALIATIWNYVSKATQPPLP
jgi:hypothetical protein